MLPWQSTCSHGNENVGSSKAATNIFDVALETLYVIVSENV